MEEVKNKILSFDVSSVSTGWSFLFGAKLREFGLIKPPSSFRLQEKLYWFCNQVNALLKVLEPDYVLIEETYLKNVRTLKTLMQFVAVANLECFKVWDKEPIFLNTNTVRSYFNLKSKEDVFDYVVKKYYVKLKHLTFDGGGNDITDSILMALYWWNVLKEKE